MSTPTTPGAAVASGRELLGRKVSLYDHTKDVVGRPIAFVEIIDGILGGKWKASVDKVRAEPDEDRQKEIKKTLPGFTAAGAFKRRNKTSIELPAGLVVIDIDGLGSYEKAVEVRDTLAEDPHVVAGFVSVRGEGVKLIVYAGEIATDAEFKAAWRAFAEYAADNYGLSLDPSGKDICRLCFVSNDRSAFVNLGDVVPFTARAEIEQELPQASTVDTSGNEEAAPAETMRPDAEESKSDAPPIENIRAALCHLDPGVEYNKWLRIGMAIKSVYPGKQGFALFDEWSKRAPDRYGGTAEAWKSIKPEGGVTVGTLYAAAEGAGWVNPQGKLYAELRRTKAEAAEVGDILSEDPPPRPKPWRGITDAEVREAIEGSRLADMVSVLEGVTVPALPIQYSLPKAIALAGCALAQPIKYDRKTETRRGLDLARNVITTSFGQLCNVWTCIVGPSGSGKDIGNLPYRIAEQYRAAIGHSGSAEGLADAYTTNGAGLLTISELGPYLDSHSWQYKATGFLTQAWNQCQAKVVLSSRNGEPRDVRYCAPSIIANVQPAVLAATGDTLLMDSGFLLRFMFSHLPEIRAWRPNTQRLDLGPLSAGFNAYGHMDARISPPAGYLQDVLDDFVQYSAPLPGHYNRLVNEYGPRLAVMLAADPNTPDVVNISDEHWQRVGVLLRWFYSMAEEVLQGIGVEKHVRKMEARLDRMLAFIKKHPKGVLKRLFSHRFSEPGTYAADRDKDLAELEAQGKIVKHSLPGGGTILKAVR